MMNETKFTPGPLLVCKAYADNGALSHYELRREDTGELVVEVCDPDAIINNTSDIELANVTLYAAAPEMYKFIEWLRTVEGQCVILKGKKYLPQILDKLDEILKKARGEK